MDSTLINSIGNEVSTQQRPRLAYLLRQSGGFLALPISAIKQHGQAAQTLAGLLALFRMDGRATFRRQADIAKASGISVRTLRRHLDRLVKSDIISTKGRQKRRTVTYKLSGVEADIMSDGFLPLPRFMLSETWAVCVVYAWLLYRAELSPNGDSTEDSLSRIAKSTGIVRRSVCNALDRLSAVGLVERDRLFSGDVGRIMLLSPPARLGGEKMAEYLVQKWPSGSAKMAGAVRKKGLKEMVQIKRMDQKEVKTEEIGHIAKRVFEKSGYTGDQGGNLWKLAALLHIGHIAEHELWDSCAGARECRARDRAAYTFAIAKGHLAKRGVDLRTELAKVRIVPTWPTSPPKEEAARETSHQADDAGLVVRKAVWTVAEEAAEPSGDDGPGEPLLPADAGPGDVPHTADATPGETERAEPPGDAGRGEIHHTEPPRDADTGEAPHTANDTRDDGHRTEPPRHDGTGEYNHPPPPTWPPHELEPVST